MNPDFLPKNYKEYLGLGAEIAASLLIPMFGGYFLDQVFNSSPVGILFGVILGIILFFIFAIGFAVIMMCLDDNTDI